MTPSSEKPAACAKCGNAIARIDRARYRFLCGACAEETATDDPITDAEAAASARPDTR